jgi:hypothetical protein
VYPKDKWVLGSVCRLSGQLCCSGHIISQQTLPNTHLSLGYTKTTKLLQSHQNLHIRFLCSWRWACKPETCRALVCNKDYKIDASRWCIYPDIRFYVHYVSTLELFLSTLGTLCTYSLIVYFELITFPCTNLICLIYVF